MASREALEKWAEMLPDRRVIEEFLEWCSTKRIELAGWDDSQSSRYPAPIRCVSDLLNEYHGIDAKELELERRALLDEVSQ